MNEFIWTVRVRADKDQTVSVHARNVAFRIGDPVSFRPADNHPCSLEVLMGALAADLIGTLQTTARRSRIFLDSIEMSVNLTLNDALAHVGVVGEDGDPSVKAIHGALYISSDEDPDALQTMWEDSLRRSPIYLTLTRAVDLQIRLEVTP